MILILKTEVIRVLNAVIYVFLETLCYKIQPTYSKYIKSENDILNIFSL